ncbi:MAG: hypothetical protein A2W91_19255 [Bacteroidetes bacterium GWF2_38_335]|nr:MAG: hypothetical protein A2W91_19255 [Bacteroidetes bacterium GWF2_38_335]OFY79897.1 MAG: hypothetical protein A2281_10655 [Bacteroidetes bacterium RIFOXYA12_FULL_38_20]HBS86353.1 hypothetical protein [Bacteroidales bacterium]
MKKLTLLTLILLVIQFSFGQQAIKLLPSESNHFSLNEKSDYRFTVTNVLSDIQFQSVSNVKGQFVRFKMDDYSTTHDYGKPELPVVRNLIEIPYNAEIKTTVVSYNEVIINLSDYGITYPLYPAQPSISKSHDYDFSEFMKDEATYTKNAFSKYPAVKVEVSGKLRGVQIGRLDIAPVQYNPVTNQLKIYTDITVEVSFENADYQLTKQEKERLYNPYFENTYSRLINFSDNFSKDDISAYPIKMVIVADPMFETILQPYIEWKTMKGFHVIEAYTDEAAVGSTTTTIKNYLQDLYDAGTTSDPAPTFVLFVGDVAQIPTFDGTTSSHKTDLYYCEYTDDFLPEIYYGRWSATNTTQLQPQIDKSLMYERYEMPDPSYLGHALMVAGVDQEGGDPNGFSSVNGNGQLQYGMENYFNSAHGIAIYEYLYPVSDAPASEAAIRSDFNLGTCLANYTAHCSSAGWANPSFETSDVPGMTNTSKFGLMIGNCCQSATFYDSECFGEAVLRKSGAGAIGYIGGSNFSYWTEDYHWGTGNKTLQADPPPTYNATKLGAYDRLFHDHSEGEDEWFITNSMMIMGGNLAVEQAGDGMKDYYWEIYHLMGDPSIMSYMGVPDDVICTFSAPLEVGATSLTVTTEDHALVAISKGGVLLDSEFSGTGSSVTLNFTALATTDALDLVVTKQFRAPYIGTVEVIEAGPIIAQFEGDPLTVVEGGTVDFTDLSTCEGTITSWSWEFTGGTPATNTTQNPAGIQYNSWGDYQVKLTVSNGTNTDAETKAAYIHVISADELYADFVGNPLVVLVGQSVDFTDMSNGAVTSWDWTFDGAVTGTSTDQNPLNIQYMTIGLYDVTLTVGDGTDTHSTTKTGYIQVVETTDPPIADFTADYTNIMIGGSVNFTDLSLNAPTSWNWTFEGADVLFFDGQTPPAITYSTPGDYTVKLAVANGLGNDTLTKVDYIHVLADTSITAPPDIDFTANERLIVAGTSINFFDLSADYPTSWSWSFEGGSPATSALQHPMGITYSSPGMYQVTLTATNSEGTGSLTKTDYIVVSDFPMDMLCDTICNVNGESILFRQLSTTWGYLPGHNGKFVTAYADKCVNYTFTDVSSFIIPVAKSYASTSKVKFIVWEGEDEPGEIIATKQVNLSSLSAGLFNIVNFDTPVPVDGEFFVGFEISYATADTFATYMASDRGPSGINTLFCKKDGAWTTATDIFDVHTSLMIKVTGCLVGIETIDIENSQITLFPNPVNNMLNIDLGSIEVNQFNIEVFDMTGRKIEVKPTENNQNPYELDMSGNAEGMYFINLNINGHNFVRKISVVR